jgi:hypothetical protein
MYQHSAGRQLVDSAWCAVPRPAQELLPHAGRQPRAGPPHGRRPGAARHSGGRRSRRAPVLRGDRAAARADVRQRHRPGALPGGRDGIVSQPRNSCDPAPVLALAARHRPRWISSTSRTRLRQGRPTEKHFDYANLARYLAAHRALAVENDVQQRAVYGAKSGLNRSTLPVKAGRRSTSWDSLAQSFRMPQAVCSSLFHLRRDANIRRRGRKRELRFTVRVCLWVAPLPACP